MSPQKLSPKQNRLGPLLKSWALEPQSVVLFQGQVSLLEAAVPASSHPQALVTTILLLASMSSDFLDSTGNEIMQDLSLSV